MARSKHARVFITEILGQTAEASNWVLRELLRVCNVPCSGTWHLWLDVGPHYRPTENIHFYCRELCESIKEPMFVRYLAEQHGKGILDAMFAVSGSSKNGWLGCYAASDEINNITDVMTALEKEAIGFDQNERFVGPQNVENKAGLPISHFVLVVVPGYP